MNQRKAVYSKLGATALFGAPAMLDAAIVHFDIPDVTVPGPGAANQKTYLAVDNASQQAVVYSYVAPGPPSKLYPTGPITNPFNPDVGIFSKNDGTNGKSFVASDGNVNTYANKTYTTPGQSYPGPKSSPSGASFNSIYVNGDGYYFSSYFPADNSTQYQFFTSSNVDFGWLEMQQAPNGDITLTGIYFEPAVVPESSTVMAFTTALAGSAFLYSRRKRKRKAESSSAEA